MENLSSIEQLPVFSQLQADLHADVFLRFVDISKFLSLLIAMMLLMQGSIGIKAFRRIDYLAKHQINKSCSPK